MSNAIKVLAKLMATVAQVSTSPNTTLTLLIPLKEERPVSPTSPTDARGFRVPLVPPTAFSYGSAASLAALSLIRVLALEMMVLAQYLAGNARI